MTQLVRARLFVTQMRRGGSARSCRTGPEDRWR